MAQPDPSAAGVLRALVLWPALFAGYAADQVRLAVDDATAVQRRLTLQLTEYAHLRSFLIDTYDGEPWVGTQDDGFRFSHDKSRACWRESERLDVLLVRADGTDYLSEFKDTVRKLCKVGKHSMHVTDTLDETRYLWAVASAHARLPRLRPLLMESDRPHPRFVQ